MQDIGATRIGIAGVGFVGLGVWLAVIAWNRVQIEQRIAAHGVTVTAEVVGWHQDADRRGNRYYYLRLCYPLPDGTTFRQQKAVDCQTYARGCRDRRLPLRYDPADPTEVLFAHVTYNGRDWYVVAAMTGFFGLMFCGFAYRSFTRDPLRPS